MTYTISRKYEFESAHLLPYVPDGHKCKQLHGHHYVMEVQLHNNFLTDVGFVLDFWDLDKSVQPLVELVDHHLLNNIEGLENPTAELIAAWFYKKLSRQFRLDKIRIWETPDCWAEFSERTSDRSTDMD